jgi:phage portal protein BeeE
LTADNLAGLDKQVTVPASEIIHDRMYTLYHPLIGVSPIFACGVAATQGLAIQANSAKFFQNMSRPSGILTAPGAISNDVAARLKESWETNFGGGNIGRVAVLGDSLKYEAMSVNAHDAQLIEQLKMTAEMIAACYHVPGYKIGVGPTPNVTNTAALNQQYYDQCLQFIIEKMELRLDEGLELEPPFEVWMDLGGLLRMDPQSRYTAHSEAIRGGWLKPNEARQEEDLLPVRGGDTPYMQQQNYSLAALDQRDTDATDGKTDVQASAMNGAQVSSLQGLLMAASSGEMPTETARAAIAAAFPLLTSDQIDAMVVPLGEVEPADESDTDSSAADADEDIDQTEMALLELLTKTPESYSHA